MERFDIDISQIKSHGCHCSKWSRKDNVGGAPIDDFDAGCRAWNSKIRCVELQGGACSDGIDFDFYTIQVEENEQISDDVDFHCAYAGDACRTAVCKIGYEQFQIFLNSADNEGPGSYFWDGYENNAVCTPQAPEQSEKICVGDAPDVVIKNA